QIDAAAQAREEVGDRRGPHRPGVEIEAGPSGRRRVKGRIDVVGTDLEGVDADAGARERAQDGEGDDGLAPAGGGGGDDEAAAAGRQPAPLGRGPSGSGSSRRPASAPNQSRPALSVTAWPMATTAGGSRPLAAMSAAARARVVSSTRCCGVVARLTTATGSAGRRPAATQGAAVTGLCFSATQEPMSRR